MQIFFCGILFRLIYLGDCIIELLECGVSFRNYIAELSDEILAMSLAIRHVCRINAFCPQIGDDRIEL